MFVPQIDQRTRVRQRRNATRVPPGHPQNRHTGREASHVPDREIAMNRLLRAVALVFLATVGPARSADLSLQRVMLSSGGVGYFEYEAAVDGDETLSLEVPLDQVDDILKSLVFYDNRGTAGEVTL